MVDTYTRMAPYWFSAVAVVSTKQSLRLGFRSAVYVGRTRTRSRDTGENNTEKRKWPVKGGF